MADTAQQGAEMVRIKLLRAGATNREAAMAVDEYLSLSPLDRLDILTWFARSIPALIAMHVIAWRKRRVQSGETWI